MKINFRWIAAFGLLPLGGAIMVLCGFGAQEDRPWTVHVLTTAAPVYDSRAPFDGQERFPQGAQLLSLFGNEIKSIFPAWAASADADLSYDASRILFAGKHAIGDHWQIYEAKLDGTQLHALTKHDDDCIRPYYLPDRRVVYACRQNGVFQLSVASLDDPDKSVVISHVSTNMLPDGILRDGRILFEAQSPLGTHGYVNLYTVYPDGSGVEAYRNDADGNHRVGVELSSGDLLMAGDRGAELFTDTSAKALAFPAFGGALRGDDRGGFAVVDAKNMIVSWRTPTLKTQMRYTLAWVENNVSQPAPCMPNMNCIEPVVVRVRPYEKSYPSALHPWSYSHLLALNSYLSQEGDLPANVIAKVRVRSIDEQGNVRVLGDSPVEKDGSFYLRVPGNRPLQMALLDRSGKVLRQEKGWMWTAAGEQRICVGCHTGPQRAPDNAVPRVLWQSTDPVDLTSTTKEK